MHNDLIHEVEDSLKQEKLAETWKEYGPYIIGGAILAVLMTALITGWQTWDRKVNTSHTAMMITAMDSEDIPAAVSAIAAKIRPGHRALSQMTAAGLLLRDGKNEEALSRYEQVAGDSSIPPLFRDMALLMAVRLQWGMPAENVDTEALLAKLKLIWADNDNPWRWHAQVQAAQIAAHGLQDYEQALAHLAVVLTADNIPPSLKERAKALDHVYAIDKEESSRP